MKEKIYIFLRTDETTKSAPVIIENDRFKIIIEKINPSQFQNFLGKRANRVYCDIDFQQDYVGREFISKIAKPLAYSIKNGEFCYI